MADDGLDLIVSNPDVLHGQPRFRGTRIPATVVLDCLVAGMSEQEIHKQYPNLPPGSIRAALSYAARLAHEELFPPGALARLKVKLDEYLRRQHAGWRNYGHDVETNEERLVARMTLRSSTAPGRPAASSSPSTRARLSTATRPEALLASPSSRGQRRWP
jgi:uncharacterized protein (DUF433 family)